MDGLGAGSAWCWCMCGYKGEWQLIIYKEKLITIFYVALLIAHLHYVLNIGMMNMMLSTVPNKHSTADGTTQVRRKK